LHNNVKSHHSKSFVPNVLCVLSVVIEGPYKKWLQNIYIYIVFKHPFILLAIVANFGDFLKDKEFVTFFFKEIFFTKWQFFATKRNTALNITHHKLFIVVLASALCLHAHSQFIYSWKNIEGKPLFPHCKQSLNSRRISFSKMMGSVIFHITSYYDEGNELWKPNLGSRQLHIINQLINWFEFLFFLRGN